MNMDTLIQSIFRRHRLLGYQDPSWFIWAANQLVQAASGLDHKPGAKRERSLGIFIALHLLR
ncbi:MAG: hypothetical protein ACOCVM_05250, partial [Desulfovibrionaceae bacterium]